MPRTAIVHGKHARYYLNTDTRPCDAPSAAHMLMWRPPWYTHSSYGLPCCRRFWATLQPHPLLSEVTHHLRVACLRSPTTSVDVLWQCCTPSPLPQERTTTPTMTPARRDTLHPCCPTLPKCILLLSCDGLGYWVVQPTHAKPTVSTRTVQSRAQS